MTDREKLQKYKEGKRNIKEDILLSIAFFGGDNKRAPYFNTKIKKYYELGLVIENLEKKIAKEIKENENK